ncbi:MAG: replication factor C large subunit [Candidatus Diapherotrites archaeon]
MPQLWTEKFFPKSLEEFIGNSEIAVEASNWAKKWADGIKQQPLLFFGQAGAGKTSLAYLIARVNNWEVFELNASDFRSKDAIERLAGAAALNASFFSSRRLVLIDEVDGLQAQDRGGAGAIIQVLKESMNPVILTANDIYADKKLAALRSAAKPLEFKKINYLSIAKRLKELLAFEKIPFEEEAVKEFAKNSEGDFRSALLDLQTLSATFGKIDSEAVKSLGFRERGQKIFSVLSKIFKGKDFKEIRSARFSSDVDNDLLFRWIEENIPRQYSDPVDTANAFNMLSKADVFNGRIFSRQYYGFLRYSSELMTSGVALSRSNEYHSFTPFQFPTLLQKLSKSRSLRALKKELGKKIGAKTHSSSREVMSKDLPFLQLIFKDKAKAVSFAAAFDLDEDELAFLMETTSSTKKVQNILAQATELKKKIIAEKRGIFHKAFEQAEEDPEQKVSIQQEDQNQTRLF